MKRNWIWFLIRLFPLVLLLVFAVLNVGATTRFVLEDFQWFLQQMANGMSIPFIRDIFDRIFAIFSGSSTFSGSSILWFVISYASYLVFAEILKLCYEVVVFLPKWITSFFERKENNS